MRAPETVSKDELFQVLCNSIAQDPRLIKDAADRLAKMVKMAGTFDGLSLIASERSVPILVRQQAILQFKNQALPNWRNRMQVLSPCSLLSLTHDRRQSPIGRGPRQHTDSLSVAAG